MIWNFRTWNDTRGSHPQHQQQIAVLFVPLYIFLKIYFILYGKRQTLTFECIYLSNAMDLMTRIIALALEALIVVGFLSLSLSFFFFFGIRYVFLLRQYYVLIGILTIHIITRRLLLFS